MSDVMVHVQTFGKFEIVRKLSRSMSDVYLALDTNLNRPVVLKLIEHSRDEYTQLIIDAEKRGAALQEQLHATDRRILQVYEYGEQDGCFFVVMEYCEGKTLAEILQAERRMEPKRAARYAVEICSQLKTLHSFVSDVNGRRTAVVHGDIKPSNVQIGTRDELRLLDFGIAKAITSTRNLTHHNLGSPTYCSPERISKSQVDPHSDLWAVGVTLYEMISGAPPYQAQNTRKLENLIQSRRPPRALPPNCPAALKAIVSKALASDLDRRYQSAGAFIGDLEAFLDGRPAAAERERQSSWYTNATVEKYSGKPSRSLSGRAGFGRSLFRAIKSWADFTNTIALLAGILMGLLIFIPVASYFRMSAAAAKLIAPKDYAHESVGSVNSDWKQYRELKSGNRFLLAWSPAALLDTAMRDHFTSGAEDMLASFVHAIDQPLSHFDWSKAVVCLRHALEIDPSYAKAKGDLALCTGYLDLIHKPPNIAKAIYQFQQTEWYLPRLPDPHLGLARIFVYQFHNVGRAIGELNQAEQLGYKPGAREHAEEADGYLFRAESELAHAKRTPTSAKADRAKYLQLAHDDIDRARALYEPIIGYANVSANLEQLAQDREEQNKLQMENVRLIAVRPHYSKRSGSIRRWQ